eukprot:c3192_g1_i1.p1 GENE.c3192_g1_i1~~c3192_g1_i1.p1  ORF type:complete len:226 (-),score=21.76 c3192_g1_i1:57-734(-)
MTILEMLSTSLCTLLDDTAGPIPMFSSSFGVVCTCSTHFNSYSRGFRFVSFYFLHFRSPRPEQVGVPATSFLCIPEYLNMIEAGLYIYSAFHYPEVSNVTYNDPRLVHMHYIELAAALVEILAAIGWTYTWWYTYNRAIPARGWTLDDPDLWACLFIVIPSFIYFAYNVQIICNLHEFGSNLLYVKADICYFVGAVCYLLAAMRDAGWFYFMPVAGAWDWKISKN